MKVKEELCDQVDSVTRLLETSHIGTSYGHPIFESYLIEPCVQNWREFLFEPDILLLLIASASGPPEIFMSELLRAYGGGKVLQAAGRLDVSWLGCLVQFIHLHLMV